jgi:hypothetical protein
MQRLTDFYKFYEKSYEPDFIWSSTYKSDYFRDEFWYYKPWSKPQGLKLRVKYILIMERVKQLETYQLRVGTHLGFTMGNNF